jgi:hypothetical protein
MKRLRSISILLLLVIVWEHAFSQTDAVTALLTKQYISNVREHLQEKIFVHTDKSFYVAGETAWFKLYNTDPANGKPSTLSKVAYIELFDRFQKPVIQTKISLNDATGAGAILLPATLNSGQYILRAYTSWMKNFSSTTFFEKPVTIVNTFKNAGIEVANKASYDIQFFPEGGNLVNGLSSKIAFRVVGADGKGIDCKGNIVNGNETVAAIKTLKAGIGSFDLTPDASKNYTAVFMINGETVRSPLPKIFASGYVMHLKQNAGTINITVDDAGKTNSLVYLLAYSNNAAPSAQQKILQNGSGTFVIDVTSLSPGISRFTVFNAEKKPVCERMFFKQPKEKLLLNVNTDRGEYEQRKKISVSINSKDESQNMVASDLSLSVFLEDDLQQADDNDINTFYWLTSELKGTVESPSYYLNSNDAVATEALENLLLVQGWSRYNWNDILNKTEPSFTSLPEYEGHVVTAKITNKNTGIPAADVITYLAVPGKNFKLAVSKSNAQGMLYFNMVGFAGSSEIILQTHRGDDSLFRIEVIPPFSTEPVANKIYTPDLNEQSVNALLQHSIGTQVQNVFQASAKNIFQAPSKAVTSIFYGVPETRYTLDDYRRFTTMDEVLREYVPEVNVKKRHGNVYFNMQQGVNVLDAEPLVLLDGVPYFNADSVLAFDPLKIKTLDVIPKWYVLGPLTVGGIMSFSTYKSDLDGFQLDPASLIAEYEAMQLQRQFYSPVYETSSQQNSRLPDTRNVLYWSPTVTTNKNGTGNVSFYSSDVPGKYVGVLQGRGANGKTGSTIFHFTVKEKRNAPVVNQ